MGKYDELALAKQIEKYVPEIGDTLLNSLQLYRSSGEGVSGELITENIKSTADQIRQYELRKYLPKNQIKSNLKILGIELLAVFMIILPANQYYMNSTNRILHPNKEYPLPKPFQIEDISNNTEVLGGEDVNLKFRLKGDPPSHMNLRLDYGDYAEQKVVKIDSNGYAEYKLKKVRKNINYRAFVTNRSPFIPWKNISSHLDSVVVTNRPEIIESRVEIDYPEYTGKEDKEIKENTIEYFALPGSEIYFEITSNKILNEAQLKFTDTTLSKMMRINGKNAYCDLQVKEPLEFKFQVTDKNNVQNINPIKYKLSLMHDEYPGLKIISPDKKIDLNEKMTIPINAKVNDDFGITKFGIEYKIKKQYGEKGDYKFVEIPLEEKGVKAKNISYSWNLNKFSLGPEDKVLFKLFVVDNDRVKGPKKTTSEVFTAVFPSLNQMYSEVKKEQQGIEKTGQEVVDQLENTKKVMDKVHRKLLKKKELSWEQRKQLNDEIKKTKNLEEKVKKISNKLDTVIKKARKNNLFDRKTLNKYAKLQETFQQIMTPELKKAMQDLQKAVNNMNPQKTQQALEKFKVNRSQFEKELEEKLKLYKRIKAEQAINEITKRMQDLAQRQNELSNNISKNKKTEKLSKNQEDIQDDTQIAKDRIKNTEQDLSEMSSISKDQLRRIRQKMEASRLTQKMSETRKQIENKKINKAKMSSKKTARELKNLSQKMQQFQKSYRQKEMQKITGDFNSVISNTIKISKNQEDLNSQLKNLPRHSNRVIDKAVEQQRIRSNIQNLMGELSELSSKTFGMPAKAQQVIGKAYNQANSCIKNLEERNTLRAYRKAKNIHSTLNVAGRILVSSLNKMQQSQSSTGFQSFMKQLKQMAQQQRKLNKKTKGMKGNKGQPMPGTGGRSALQKLAARQKQIQKSLRQLQKKRKGSGQGRNGELKGANKAMEKVIQDLKNNKILKKTLNQQDKILTRMLDAQKSLRKRGFQNKRKSKTGQKSDYVGPGNLPDNLGERKNLLNQRLEQALNNNYSQEYEDIIRRYFDRLMRDNQNENRPNK